MENSLNNINDKGKVIEFGRYREFSIMNIDCWYDRKSREYCAIAKGMLFECATKKELQNRLAMALRLAI